MALKWQFYYHFSISKGSSSMTTTWKMFSLKLKTAIVVNILLACSKRNCEIEIPEKSKNIRKIRFIHSTNVDVWHHASNKIKALSKLHNKLWNIFVTGEFLLAEVFLFSFQLFFFCLATNQHFKWICNWKNKYLHELKLMGNISSAKITQIA